MLTAACALPKPPRAMPEERNPTMLMTLLPQGTLARGKATNVWLKVTNIAERRLLTAEDLKTVRNYPIHLMVIDQSLSDYQHIHPEPTGIKGVFRFSFTPKEANRYRLWADVVPAVTGQQEFVMADLSIGRGHVARSKAPSDHATAEGYRFALHWDRPLKQLESSTATLSVTDSNGNAVPTDSIVLAHVDGFFDDFHTVLHVNALSETGEGKMRFAIDPDQDGFLKLYVLVIINGKPVNVPFAVQVAPES